MYIPHVVITLDTSPVVEHDFAIDLGVGLGLCGLALGITIPIVIGCIIYQKYCKKTKIGIM